MTRCAWCGDDHPLDRLCERAQAGASRRRFFFMFGAGVAGAALAGRLPFVDDYVTGIRRTGEVTFPVSFEPPRAYVDVVVQLAGQFGVDMKGTLAKFGEGASISFRTDAPIGSLEVGKAVKIDGVGLIAPAHGFADPIIGHVVSATLVVDREKKR